MGAVYHYYRYFTPGSEEMDSLQDALARAWWDIEENHAAPDRIESDGKVYGRDAIDSYLLLIGQREDALYEVRA